MTDDELKAIEARIEQVLRLPVTSMNTEGWVTPDDVARDDAPKLVAEVRRLRKVEKLRVERAWERGAKDRLDGIAERFWIAERDRDVAEVLATEITDDELT